MHLGITGHFLCKYNPILLLYDFILCLCVFNFSVFPLFSVCVFNFSVFFVSSVFGVCFLLFFIFFIFYFFYILCTSCTIFNNNNFPTKLIASKVI